MLIRSWRGGEGGGRQEMCTETVSDIPVRIPGSWTVISDSLVFVLNGTFYSPAWSWSHPARHKWCVRTPDTIKLVATLSDISRLDWFQFKDVLEAVAVKKLYLCSVLSVSGEEREQHWRWDWLQARPGPGSSVEFWQWRGRDVITVSTAREQKYTHWHYQLV